MMSAMVRELLPPETGLGFAAMRELRPGLRDEADFVHRVDEVQRAEGYRLLGAFAGEGGESAPAVAVAGFRAGHSLADGHYLYVDDLSTLPAARRAGHARSLLDWLMEEAERLGCDHLMLDSAVGPQRTDAHRLYFNAGYEIAAFHFERAVASRT
jgi:GNAT superfamily N-acetyltransferase